MFGLIITVYGSPDTKPGRRDTIIAGSGRIRTCTPVPATDRFGRVNLNRPAFTYVAEHTVLNKITSIESE
jgi:hypothetical protein